MLASGSKGNSTVLSSSGASILVDAGLSCRETLKRMRSAGEDPERLKAILISHEHQDHVNGLSVLARKLKVPVYLTNPTYREWERAMAPPRRKFVSAAAYFASRSAPVKGSAVEIAVEAETETEDQPPAKPDLTEASVTRCSPEEEEPELKVGAQIAAELPALEYFSSGQRFAIGDIEILPFTIPHDAADPVGFLFRIDGVKIAIVTDLGYVTENVKVHLRNCDVLMIESNHDVEMLREGPYPWSVKQRVLSRVGHLSNRALAHFLANDYDGGAAFLVLAHLSEANNHPELARKTAEQALGEQLPLIANKLLLASQSEPLEPIRL